MHNIKLERIWDAERSRNLKSPWEVHHLIASLDGEQVGCLKISHIPRERFHKRIGNIFDFVVTQCGLVGMFNWKTNPREAVNLGFHSLGSLNYRTQDVEADMKDLEEMLKIRFAERYEEFEFFHVDKPTVDQIKVEEAFRRRGIATILYVEGTKWMWEHGMYLHASGIQTDYAKMVWEKMKRERYFKRFPKTLSADRCEKNMRFALDPMRLEEIKMRHCAERSIAEAS